MRGFMESVSLTRGKSLNLNGITKITEELAVGEGWHKILLRFNFAVTIGTGSGAITEGLLKAIQNILLRTDRGEEIVANCPGRMMYKYGQFMGGTAPALSTLADATATYSVSIPIYFIDPFLARPGDTILDTSRYQSLSLDVTLGGIADLYGTPGTATVTCTLDIDVFRTQGLLHQKGRPILHTHYGTLTPQDANSVTEMKLQRSDDMAIKRLLFHTGSSGSAGVPFGGTNADDIIDYLSIRDQAGFILQERLWEQIQNDNKLIYGLETIPSGFGLIDFVLDGSIHSALWTGGKSDLKGQWVNDASVVASDFVSIGFHAIRTLK